MILDDRTTRPLTPQEGARRARLLVVLGLLSTYLSRASWATTLPQAQALGAAVALRERRVSTEITDGVRVAVHPPTILAWWSARPGLHVEPVSSARRAPVSLNSIVEALEFMGADELTRLSPVGEFPPAFPASRSGKGWWNLTREMTRRLLQECYVPVLTPRPGPHRVVPDGSLRPVVEVPARLRVAIDPDMAIELVRRYTDPTRATALLETAQADARPLVTRRRGRPPADSLRPPPLHLSSVVVGLGGLTAFAVEHRDLLALDGPPSRTAVRDAVEAARRVRPALLEPVDSFGAVDTDGPVRRLPDWWRVRLAEAGHYPVEPDVVAGEIAAWRIDRARAAEIVLDDDGAPAEVPPEARRPRESDPDWFHQTEYAPAGFVTEAERAAMTRTERAKIHLLYPDE